MAITPANTVEAFDPDVATDGTHWIVAWAGNSGPPGFTCVTTSRSSDFGVNWTTPAGVGMCRSVAQGFILTDERVQIAADASTALVVWGVGDQEAIVTGVYAARSTDGGATWLTEAVSAGEKGRAESNASVATDGHGTWMASWVSRPISDDTLDNKLMSSRSTDAGMTWSPPLVVADRVSAAPGFLKTPRLAGDGAGRWLLTWTDEADPGPFGQPLSAAVMASGSLDGGVTWTAPTVVSGSDQPDVGFDAVAHVSPDVASDGAGNWVVVWGQFESTLLERTFGEIVVTHSNDVGATWTAPTVISLLDDDDHTPALVADGGRRFGIVWSVDYPDDHLRFASSSDGGLTWSPSARAAARVPSSGKDVNPSPPALAADAKGALMTVWSDPVGSGSGAFVARATGTCGDGVLDVGESCDDGNLVDGDGCDHTCTPTGCGNGVLTAGEACDPDPDHPDECCAADCQFAGFGTPCSSDQNVCTDDVCDGADTCTHLDNSAPCSDGDDRTVDDVCTDGVCRGSLPVPVVRVVYLVPSDRTPNPSYTAALTAALEHVRIWFRNALDGRTFAVPAPAVEVISTPHPADWYGTNGGTGEFTFFNNVVADGATAVPRSQRDLALYVIDARPPCGQSGAAVSGDRTSAVESARTLEGLIGDPDRPECPETSPDVWGPCRWGGEIAWSIAVEAGAPGDCIESGSASCDDVLTSFGYLRYPAARLLPSDVDALAVSDIFVPISGLPTELPPCACGFEPTEQATCTRTCSLTSCDDGDPCTVDFCGSHGCATARVGRADVLTCAFSREGDAATSCATDRTGGAILARVTAAGNRIAATGADEPSARRVRRVAHQLKRLRHLRTAAARRGHLQAACGERLRGLIDEALSQIRQWRQGVP
jgi:cysteine-rich repeat protein